MGGDSVPTAHPPADVVVSCVVENRPRWAQKLYNLALSLRAFGGALAGVPLRAFFVDGLEPRFQARVAPLGVSCRVVSGFPAPVPQTNKLRMFEDFSRQPSGILVALDCDVVVVDDFSASLSPAAVCGVPAMMSPLRPPQWQALLALLGLRPDGRGVRTAGTGEELAVPYLNSGVLFVPWQHCAELTSLWRRYINALLELHATLGWPARVWFYLDQIALACALLAGGIPVQTLDIWHNFPSHQRVHASALQAPASLRILHYHQKFGESGHLLPAPRPPVDHAVGRFNAALSRALGEGHAGDAPRRPRRPRAVGSC
jgi:hypothetical protein